MVLELIRQRRSIRKFTREPVSDEQIRALLEAAMAAPSASNRQPWEFIVVRDPASCHSLSQVHPYAGPLVGAPVVIVVCGHPELAKHWNSDCAAATQNLLLAVTALGLGAVWVGITHGADNEASVREILGIPNDVAVLCMIPLGHPAETRPARTQYDAAKVHYEKY
jgi:nitroreductase